MNEKKETPKRRRVHPKTGKLSRTKQAFKDQCDFNLVLKNFQKTGVMTHYNGRTPQYGDFSLAGDLQSSLEAVRAAQADFAALAAPVRAAAANNPVQFLEMMADPDGIKVLQEAGLEVFDPEALADDLEKKMEMPSQEEPEKPSQEEPENEKGVSGTIDNK